jgi:hypothetical protein
MAPLDPDWARGRRSIKTPERDRVSIESHRAPAIKSQSSRQAGPGLLLRPVIEAARRTLAAEMSPREALAARYALKPKLAEGN